MQNINLKKVAMKEKKTGENFLVCIAETLEEKKRYINFDIRSTLKKWQRIN